MSSGLILITGVFAFSIVKGLSEHVVKILALKFEPKKVMPKRPNFH